MTLWRLEWIRLLRSRRLLAVVTVYVFFGATGPFVARYLAEIVERFGTDVVVQLPEATPADGISQFTANASQIGLLVAVFVIAGSVAIDAIPEMSVFLRTRVDSVWDLMTPRVVASLGAVTAAFLAGLAFAWYETVVLLGGLPVGALLVGASYTIVYLAFVVALVTAVASRAGSILATVAISVFVLLLLPIVGIAEAIGRWLPSHLLGALDRSVRGISPWTEYLPAAAVTVVSSAALLRLAARWTAAREL